MTAQKITPFLWFDTQAEQAMNFYTSVFKDAKVISIKRYPEGPLQEPMKGMEGKVLTGVFQLEGQQFMCLDGGPVFKFTPSVSFFVSCITADEVDQLFNKLGEDGSVLMPLQQYPFSEKYGWLQDKYGLSWQIGVGQNPQKITPSLMFVGSQFGKAEQAINFYTSVFKNSSVEMIAKYEPGEGDEEGKVKFALFKLEGQAFSAMESSKEHKFEPNPAVSLYVECADQAEVDYYWSKLSANPAAEQCGWLQDKYGFSWQIIPQQLPQLLNDPDTAKANRVLQAMLQMKKIDVAGLEEAASGQ